MGHELLPSIISDRALLHQVRNLPSSQIYQPGQIPEPRRDQAELRRVLPLFPAPLDFALVSGLSAAMALLFWAATILTFQDPPHLWLFSFAYGATGLVAVCLVLALTRHGYALLGDGDLTLPLGLKLTGASKAVAYQFAAAIAFLIAFLMFDWSALPMLRRMAATAGYLAPRSNSDDYFYPAIICTAFTGLIAPSLIAKWRGAGLRYPTRPTLWLHRLFWSLLAIIAMAALVAFAHEMIGRSIVAEGRNLLRNSSTAYNSGNYDEAMETIEKAILFDPTNAESYRVRCLVERKLARIEDAIAACNKAIALAERQFNRAATAANRHDLIRALRSLSFTLIVAREPAAAAAPASQAAQLDSSSLATRALVGIVDLFVNKVDEAKQIFTDNKSARPPNEEFFVDIVNGDFKLLRETGIDTPEMKAMEQILGSSNP